MNEQLGFGGNPRPIDARDYQIPLGGVGMPVVRPVSATFPVPTIYMQDKYPTCGAHAGAQLINVAFKGITSPKYLWKFIKTIDGFPLESGTDMRSIFKSITTNGVCDLSLLDDSLENSIEQYSDVAEVTQAMKDNASTNKALSYAFINNPTINQIKDTIFQHGGALLLIDITDAFWINGWQESATCPLWFGKPVGHHFIFANGYDEKYVYFANSWSDKWGRQGNGYFDESYIPHVLEMGVATVNVVPPVAKYQFARDLSVGSWGSDVFKLQEFLISGKYGTFTPTGFFGRKTQQAVLAFQIKNNITPALGYFGPKSRAVANNT